MSLSIPLMVSAATTKIPSTAKEWKGHYYQLYHNCMKFADANTFCKSLGGHLATISSAAENRMITNYLDSEHPGCSAMIGLYDANGSNGTWDTWVTGEKVKYQNWGAGQPDWTGQTICVINTRANSTYRWEVGEWDNGWDGDYWFLCEWDSGKTSIKNATVKLSSTSYTYNGKTREPKVTVQLNKKTLTEGTDYTVTYIANKFPGYGYAKIVGKGKYTGSLNKYFKIKPKQITGVSVKRTGTKQITVKWNKMNYITGYQIQYTKSFGKTYTVKAGSNLTSKVLKKLSKSTYSVRVRAYATNNGKTAYGNWSSIKTINVK